MWGYMKHKNDYIFTENQFVCLDFAFVKVWRILFIADTANTSDILGFLYASILLISWQQ